jgi:hypothetical protein
MTYLSQKAKRAKEKEEERGTKFRRGETGFYIVV